MISFVRGSTTKVYATIKEEDVPDMSTITSIWFMMRQGRDLIIDHQTEDCYIVGRKIYTNLSQEETLKFRSGYGDVQISILIGGADRRKVSYTARFEVDGIIKEGVQDE